MELLIIWIITVLISLGMEFSFFFNVLKDLANSGYKLNYVKLARANHNADLETIKTNRIMLFIPFFNLFKELQKAYTYKEQSHYILDSFRVIDVIEELTEEESKEYEQNPTAITAMKFIIDNAPPIFTVKLDDGSIICYYISDEDPANKNNIVITKVKGPAQKLNEKEQKQEIIKKLEKQVDEVLNKFAQIEKELEKASNNTNKKNYDFVASNQLENNQYVSENSEDTKEDKPKTLTKKINRK